MKERFMATINAAIDNGTEIGITMEAGSNAVAFSVVPFEVIEGEGNVVIYAGSDIITVDTTNMVYDNDEFICVNNNSVISIAA